ncbi:MAG: VanW family protein [Armatimonadetes bacterium]|nr:VanW family protein [Armatimonadota bacterium]
MRFLPLAAALVAVLFAATSLTKQAPAPKVLAKYATPLSQRQGNQKQNAIRALKQLDGIEIPPGGEFSFNETVGSWSRDKGYRRAPVSFGGTLVDAWGGGVCQTSTTLYNAALLAGLEVVERHRHHYAPAYVPAGRDAAVAFPNIDLRFRNPFDAPVTIRTMVTDTSLIIEFVGAARSDVDVEIVQRVVDMTAPSEFVIGSGRFGRVRNPGRAGYEVETYRIVGGVKELLSVDNYPVMHRITEYRSE